MRKAISILMVIVMIATCQSVVFAGEFSGSAANGDPAGVEESTAAAEGETTVIDETLSEETASEETSAGETEAEGTTAGESITEETVQTEPEETAPTGVSSDATETTEVPEEEPSEIANKTVSAAAETDWKCPSSGKYTIMLKSDGSVLELHKAAGQSVGGYDTVQGGCVNKGIGYFSLTNRNNVKYSKIIKVKLSTGKVLKVSKAMKIYHANDLTYNTKTNKIIVAHAEGDRKHLSIVDPSSLKVISKKKITVNSKCGMTSSQRRKYVGFGAIAYNAKHDEYVVRLNNLGNLLILDSNFKAVRYVKLSKKIKQTMQGLDSVNDYFLVGASPKKGGQYNLIAVYDYKGKYKKQIKIRKSFELESVMHDGKNTYIAMYEEGTIRNKAGTLRNDFVMKLGTDDGKYIFPVVPAQNNTVSIYNKKINKWLGSYSKKAVKKYATGKNIYYPRTVKLRWSIDEGVKASYKIKLSRSSKLTNCRIFTSDCACVTVGNLKSNTTYYWKVISSYGGRTVESGIAKFKTGKGPRTVKVSGVGNIRDIGGWKTKTGAVIRQGMVYRSANLDSINSKGRKTMLKTFGIRTDLDLRQKGNGLAGKRSPLGDDVNYVQLGTDGGVFIEDADTKAGRRTIAKEIRVFADKSNYPMVVHCRIGRDRTGLVCYLIEALLGVSPENLLKEYQISFFSKAGNRYMKTVDNSYTQITKMEKILRSYGDSDDSLQKCTEKYLLKCGLKKSELNKIKEILIKE